MVDAVAVGIIIVLAGFVIVFLAAILAGRSQAEKEPERRTSIRGGGVVLIGPIPIIFGSDAKWATVAIVLAIILVLITLFMTFYGGH